ncbi:MAG TPA: ABC transporter ATP-binding protein [Candidatus Brocadiaceae bacterium]
MELIKKIRLIADKEFYHKMIIMLVMVIIAAAFETIGIGLIVPYIQLLGDPQRINEIQWLALIYKKTGFENNTSFLILLSVVLIGFYIIKNSYLLLMYFLQFHFCYEKKISLSSNIFRSYLSRPYSFHLQRNTSELLRNVTLSVDNAIDNGLLIVIGVIAEMLVALCIFILLIVLQPLPVLLGIFLVGLPAIIVYKFIRHKATRWGREMQYHTSKMMQWVNQGLGAIKEIMIAGRQDFFDRAFYKSRQAQINPMRLHAISNKLPLYFIETVVVTGILLITVIVINRQYSMENILSMLALFAVAAFRLIPSISRIIGGLGSLRFGMAAIDEIYKGIKDFRDQNLALEAPQIKDNFRFEKHFTLDRGCYHYPDSEKMVLKDITFTINRGQSVAIAGSSGAGKTTLIDVILGLLLLTSGKMMVDGKNISGNLHSWQRKIGYVPQEIYLLDDTVRRNIAFGIEDKDIDEMRIKDAISMAQLEEVIAELPEGFDTVIGERGVRLSGGQRQRIGVSRALYNNPEILILDEATSAIDNESEAKITLSIKNLSGQKTIIIIAHRMTLVKECDVVYFLQEGKIVDSGLYADLTKRNKDFLKMLNIPDKKEQILLDAN